MKRWTAGLPAVFLGLAALLVLSVPGAGAQEPRNGVLELTLEEAIRGAVESNEELEIYRLKIRSARVALDKARGAADSIPGELVASLDMARAKRLVPRQAEMGLLLAEKGYEDAREALKLEVEKEYYELLKTGQALELARRGESMALEQLKLAEAGYEAGTLARNEVLAAEAALSEARARVVAAEASREIAAMALNASLGLGLDTRVRAASSFSYTPANALDLEQGVMRALERRFEVVKAREELELKRLDMDLVSSYYTPNVYDYQLAEVALKEAEAAYRKARRDAELSVRSAYLRLRAAEQRILMLDKAVEVARENMRLAQLRYKAGLTTGIEVSGARLALERAEGERLEAVYDYNLALAVYRNASGDGLGD